MKSFLWLFLFLCCSCRTGGYEGPISDHFDGERFFQPGREDSDKSLLQVLRWQLLGEREEWPERVDNIATAQLPTQLQNGEFSVTFINHATLLIQLPGLNILTDPIWSERTSPVSWAGPKRVCTPGLPFELLPRIHAVLISHNHYDHLDVPTLQRLSREHQPRIFVPLGDKLWLEEEGVERVEEVDWGQSLELGPDVRAVFTPSQHWSARGLFDRNRSLWGSYLLQFTGRNIYFAGDTGYGPHFKETAKTYGKVWLAFLPIGAYEPRWFMKEAHMNPAEAVEAHQDLGATHSLGIHYGCWQLTDEGIERPIQDLKEALRKAQMSEAQFEPAVVGRSYSFRQDSTL